MGREFACKVNLRCYPCCQVINTFSGSTGFSWSPKMHVWCCPVTRAYAVWREINCIWIMSVFDLLGEVLEWWLCHLKVSTSNQNNCKAEESLRRLLPLELTPEFSARILTQTLAAIILFFSRDFQIIVIKFIKNIFKNSCFIILLLALNHLEGFLHLGFVEKYLLNTIKFYWSSGQVTKIVKLLELQLFHIQQYWYQKQIILFE